MNPPTEPLDPCSHERERVDEEHCARSTRSRLRLRQADEAGKILVLGLGNDLLTDDAVGLHIARAVQARLADEPYMVVRETMEMGLALLDEIAGFDALVLVDSIQTGAVPAGHIHEFDLTALGAGRRITAPHFLGVADTLALGRTLGLAMPHEVRIIAIEVADPFTLGTRMTPALEQTVEAAAGLVSQRAHELAALNAPVSAEPNVSAVQPG